MRYALLHADYMSKRICSIEYTVKARFRPVIFGTSEIDLIHFRMQVLLMSTTLNDELISFQLKW